MKDAVCPVHRMRQLSETGHCNDCGFNWLESVIKGAELKISWAKSDRDIAVKVAEQQYEAELGRIAKEAKAANIRYSALKESHESVEVPK